MTILLRFVSTLTLTLYAFCDPFSLSIWCFNTAVYVTDRAHNEYEVKYLSASMAVLVSSFFEGECCGMWRKYRYWKARRCLTGAGLKVTWTTVYTGDWRCRKNDSIVKLISFGNITVHVPDCKKYHSYVRYRRLSRCLNGQQIACTLVRRWYAGSIVQLHAHI